MDQLIAPPRFRTIPKPFHQQGNLTPPEEEVVSADKWTCGQPETWSSSSK